MKKEKEKEQTVKMSGRDKFMAIMRSQQYFDDYERLRELRNRDDESAEQYARHIAEKWNLRYPLPRPFREDDYKIYLDESTVKIINPNEAKSLIENYSPLEIKEGGLDAELLTECIEKACDTGLSINHDNNRVNNNLKPEEILDHLYNRPSYIKGKHLFLVIDITTDKQIVRQEIETILNHYQSIVPKPEGRMREVGIENRVDPWIVYDHHHFANLNFGEITRHIFGKDEKGNDKKLRMDEYQNYYKTIRRYYDKACRMIKQVSVESEQ